MKKNKNKGFTLAELLIVVAIIGVLVAISIPIFTSQLEKAREATDAANIRSQYAEVMAEAITDGGNVNGQEKFGAVKLKQKKDGWQSTGLKENLQGTYQKIEGGDPKAGGTAWVEYNDDKVILHYGDGNGNSGSGNAGGGSTGEGNTGESTGGGTSGGSAGGSTSGGNTGGSTGGGSLGGGPGSSEDQDQINPTTKLPIAFNAPIYDWKKETDNKPNYEVVPGRVYSYKENIYFGAKNYTLTRDDLTNNTIDKFKTDTDGWWILAQYTGKVWEKDQFSADTPRYDVNQGDLCQVNDDYYTYIDGGHTTKGPEYQSSQWVKIIK